MNCKPPPKRTSGLRLEPSNRVMILPPPPPPNYKSDSHQALPRHFFSLALYSTRSNRNTPSPTAHISLINRPIYIRQQLNLKVCVCVLYNAQ
jgi:hypothetical protein